MVIETIRKEDIPEIIALGLATPELHIESDEAAYYSADMLESFITSPNDIFLAAKIDNKLAGYFLGTYNPFLKEAYLIDLVVKPEFRNMKVASVLLSTCFTMLREKGCLWAWCLVHEDNEAMMQILQKKGFAKGRKFNFFYKVNPF